MKTSHKAKQRPIDFYKNEKDFLVLYCAGLGLSCKCISEMTGFTRGQIDRRLQKAGIRIGSYRTGNTPVAQFVLKHTRSPVEKYIMKQLT